MLPRMVCSGEDLWKYARLPVARILIAKQKKPQNSRCYSFPTYWRLKIGENWSPADTK